MPKDERNTKPEQLASDEKFRSFFTTTVVDLPKEMTQDDLQKPEPKKGLFGSLFGKKKADPQEDMALELPTGEILLGDGAPETPADDMELTLRTADPGQDFPQVLSAPQKQQETKPEPQPKPEPEPKPEPAPKAAPAPQKKAEPKPDAKPEQKAESAKQSAAPAQPKSKKAKQRPAKNAPVVLLPQEQQEQQEMQQLKDLLGDGKKPKSTPVKHTAAPVQKPVTAAVESPAPAPAVEPGTPLPKAVFASVQEEPEHPEQPVPAIRLTGNDEPAPDKEDTMSLPLVPEEPEAPAPSGFETPILRVEAEDAVDTLETDQSAEPDDLPETPTERLRRMSAELTLRCVLSGIFAAVLLHFGLAAEGLLPAISVLDPNAAPAAFYGANLLFLAASIAAAYPVVRDGLAGLRGKPTCETMPALAAVAASLQAVLALLHSDAFRAGEGLTLLSGIAALGLFLALLGSRVMLAAVQSGCELMSGGELERSAFRTTNKELIRTLAENFEQKDPWILLDRPAAGGETFVEQSLGERASERRSRKFTYILLGAALLASMLLLLTGKGLDSAVCGLTAVLCIGAPLSSTLIAGIAALRLERAGAAVGAVVPGWSAIEELGGVDTLQLDAEDLFTAESVTLEDIRIFKGGRIDRAILYTASILNQSCGTLRGLFAQIIEDRTDILFPVKDLQTHIGLGFSAWCGNDHVLIGNRAYLEQEEIALPEPEYEAGHSRNGELQILYLAVSGNLHAMFVLRYVGGRNTARSLAVLQKEGIHLLVRTKDPSLTAAHIAQAYHLEPRMVSLLNDTQCVRLEAADAPAEPCCLYHSKGLSSLTGALQAAEQAQNAEISATTVQLVSVGFSVAIGLLLAWAGSIVQISSATVLMYQAAWSALSIAVCALKQHS